MHGAFGGLQIAANTTGTLIAAIAAKFTQGWAAIAASAHGNQDVVASTANSRLTLTPGVYQVVANLSMRGETVAGTSGDATGNITGQIYRGGSAVAGLKGTADVAAAAIDNQLQINGLVEISQALADAGTNYVELYLVSGDANGNDIIVTEAQFFAVKLS